MAKLSEESKKKIAESVKRSWESRRAKLATAKSSSAPAMPTGARRRRRLSADAKRRIAASVKRSWAARRAGRPVGSGKGRQSLREPHILAAVQRASQALRSLTLADLRPLAGRRDAALQLDELATLASDLKRLIAP